MHEKQNQSCSKSYSFQREAFDFHTISACFLRRDGRIRIFVLPILHNATAEQNDATFKSMFFGADFILRIIKGNA